MPRGYDSDGNRVSGGSSKRKARKFEIDIRRDEFDASLLKAAYVWETLEFVLQEGGALRFGLTRDGGAFALGVYGGDKPTTMYARTEEELEVMFKTVYDAFKGVDDV
jgi:hypothetical protein